MSPLHSLPSLPFYNNDITCTPFYVRRIICIGRNYAEHAKEMGHNPNEAPPFFFYKPITALTCAAVTHAAAPHIAASQAAAQSTEAHAVETEANIQNGAQLTLPNYSQNIHHELEISIAIGKPPTKQEPESAILGCGIALDMTCRDTQSNAKKAGRPWDTAKGFDGSAPCSALYSATWQTIQAAGEFTLTKNGQIAQTGHPKDMIWNIPSLIEKIQTYTQLGYGDLILTGTPQGVAQVQKGDILEANYKGIGAALKVNIV